ncbi:MAG: M42 family metallopeptidase [Bacteroidales bacterium]|nr:M42 family metallopeptidase [Bacteroidales bacterium]
MNFKLIKKLSEVAGPSGFEDKIRETISKEIKSDVDSLTTDNMGNLVAFRKGASRKKLMIAAHMDEIGFIVTHIDDEGFLKFATLGGFDPKTLTAQRVIVHGKKDIIGVMGAKPIHVMTPEERDKKVVVKDFFIDLGMTKKEVEKIVEIGTPITRDRECIEMGQCVNGKSLDNRIAVYILIETIKNLKGKKLPFDTYFVFTVQEEVGLRGAQVAALNIQPNVAIALDTTIAYDVPGSCPQEQITKLGMGPGIKIMDSSVICNTKLVSFMKSVAEKNKIPYQAEIMQGGGTDTSMLQKMVAGGAIAGAVSIPTRHLHQVIESVHKKDVDNSIALLSNITNTIDKL